MYTCFFKGYWGKYRSRMAEVSLGVLMDIMDEEWMRDTLPVAGKFCSSSKFHMVHIDTGNKFSYILFIVHLFKLSFLYLHRSSIATYTGCSNWRYGRLKYVFTYNALLNWWYLENSWFLFLDAYVNTLLMLHLLWVSLSINNCDDQITKSWSN